MANQRHEAEKDYMVTLQAVGITTSSYSADTALERDSRPEGDMAAGEDLFNEEEAVSPLPVDSSTTDPILDNGKPLLFFYDCETTGGSHLRDHIIEVGSVVEIPEGASITTAEFSSLCHTSQHIVRQGLVLQTVN